MDDPEDNYDYVYDHAHRLNAQMARIRQDPHWEPNEKHIIAGRANIAKRTFHGEG